MQRYQNTLKVVVVKISCGVISVYLKCCGCRDKEQWRYIRTPLKFVVVEIRSCGGIPVHPKCCGCRDKKLWRYTRTP